MNPSAVSYWLETCGDDLTPRGPLVGKHEADVAILGAGYSGLWTAYYLLRRNANLRVVLLEAEIAGFGASGRNGGWVSGGFPLSPDVLADRYGTEAARATLEAVSASIDEITAVLARERIDADQYRGGVLRVARGEGQVAVLKKLVESWERLGLGTYELLQEDQLRRRIRIDGARMGAFSPACASIHPGKLVRALARTVERLGGVIHEGSPVVRFEGSPRARLVTERGEVTAGTVVLAGEAYLTRLRGQRRSLLPVYSSIVLTEPLEAEMWERIGWEGRECASSMRLTVDYLIRTPDGRILFGSRGANYRFGSRLPRDMDHDPDLADRLRRMLVSWFPALHGARVTHAWSGPIAMPRDWMPSASYDRQSGIAWTRGYTGQGVAISNLSARILVDLITQRQSELTRLPLANHVSPHWEREPVRWLAVRGIQLQLQRLDRSERNGRAPSGRSVAERLARH